jgi:hypothetical protein
MSRIDSLPADQKAVLQLLLKRGSRYDELSGVLSIDEAEVRRRAHGALSALGPAETPGLSAERRGQIGDYLLGQQSGEEAAASRGFLEGSASGRAWAREVAAELRELSPDGLPEVPSDPDDDAEPAPALAAGATAAGTAADPATAASAPAAAAAEADTATAAGEPARGRPRASRRGGAILLAGLLAVAVAVVLVFVLRDSDSGGGGESATPAASTSTTQGQPEVLAQANLVPPGTRKGSKALGVVLIQRANGQQQIVAAVQGLSKPKSGGYGIWLYSGPSRERWLGFFASQDDQGRLLARGELKEPISGYREILVTREAKGNPSSPGSIFLRGPVQLASAGG